MHSCEPLPAAPATGPTLLQQLGRLIIRARSTSPASPASPAPRAPREPRDRLLQAKLRAANPSTSAQVSQPKPEPEKPGVEAQLESHVTALWTDQVPVCIEVLLAPDCAECFAALSRSDGFDKAQGNRQGLLLERWTMRARVNKSHEKPAFITSQWLLNAVRSQLHFSQLAAWLARLTNSARPKVNEQCNYKKLESNCDETDPANEGRQLNIVYSIKIPGEHKITEFTKPPTDHCFPITDIGDHVYLNVVVESLPRIHDIPTVKCTCQKRRASKEVPVNVHEELVGKLNDLTIGQKYAINSINTLGNSSRRLSIITNQNTITEYMIKNTGDDDKKDDKIVDDRMHTNCSENGKHKCSCDEESDRSSNNFNNEPKKLDERRLKEIAKYKRRLRKESKWKKLCDSTSSEGDGLKRETHTSIPILQASRFDRFRAIGCYRNQTYLTLPASRIEVKSPFIDSVSIPPTEFKKTVSISTQTDDILCQCGVKVNLKCENCRMVRSDANYNLASLNQGENGGRRKREEDTSSSIKLKCDNLSNNSLCDSISLDDDSFSNNDLIKRPKLRRFYPVTDRIDKILTDRCNNDAQRDMEQLHLKTDDSVFVVPKFEAKRQKTFSISEDYVTLEKCDYGTFDRCDMDSPREELSGFQYPDLKTEDLDSSNTTPNRYHNFNKSDSNENSHNSNHHANLNDISPSNHVHDQYSPINYNLSQNSSNLNQRPLNLNQHPPNLNQHPPNLNQHPPNLNQHPPNLNQHHQHQNDDQGSLDLKSSDHQVPSPSEMDRFRWRFDSAASMVFHTKTGLPLTSSPAPLRRGNNCFDFDDSINGISGIKSALFHPISPPVASPPAPRPPRPMHHRLRVGPSTRLLGSFEESALKGRLEPVATVAGFSAELGASGAFCPPHRRLPVTVFFYAPGGTNAPYMGHINLGASGYRVARSGTIQVSLFNPHGTLVKMFVVLYDLTCMPPMARTFLRQRTLYMPAGAEPPATHELHKWLRYLIHLRFMTSKSGKLYLHTDIRILVSRKADLDTATAHSALLRPMLTNQRASFPKPTNQNEDSNTTNKKPWISTNDNVDGTGLTNNRPNRVFGGCGDFEENRMREIGYDNQNGVSYELRSFTYAPDNPRYSPR